MNRQSIDRGHSPTISQSSLSEQSENEGSPRRDLDMSVDVEKQEVCDTEDSKASCSTDENAVVLPGAPPVGTEPSKEAFVDPEEEARGRFGTAMDRVLSRASSKGTHPGPPPDGGWRAWIVGEISFLHNFRVDRLTGDTVQWRALIS
jgi:hypothetical protein